MVAKKASESLLYPHGDDSIMELSLMMSRRQFDGLEQHARGEGLSVAQFLRRLVDEAVTQEPSVG